jgi:hypothetical protein
MKEWAMQCRVKRGKQLPHDGRVLDGDTDVELRPDIAFEVRHLVDEVLPSGAVRPIGGRERAEAELAAALASARPHERISILEAAQAAGEVNRDALAAAIAEERAQLAAEIPPGAEAPLDAETER